MEELLTSKDSALGPGMNELSIRQRSRLWKTALCRRLATRPATLAVLPQDCAIEPPVWVLEPVLLVAAVNNAVLDQRRTPQSEDEKSPGIFKVTIAATLKH